MATNNAANYQPTNHAVQVGGASGSLTSLAVGSTGNLLVGVSSADPAFGSSANADFTFGGTNSGATRTLTVSNTSNTASSAANLLVTVGGSSAADATHQAVVSGVTTWTWGVDNSDSDAFCIAASTALGTTNVMRVATSGEINYPLQSAFLATKTTNTANQTGDGTTYTFSADSEIFDQNGDYNGTTTYTAPITGRVCLFHTFFVAGITVGMNQGFTQITTSNRSYITNAINVGVVMTATNDLAFCAKVFADMDSGDTATSVVNFSGGTKVADINGATTAMFFGGYIAC